MNKKCVHLILFLIYYVGITASSDTRMAPLYPFSFDKGYPASKAAHYIDLTLQTYRSSERKHLVRSLEIKPGLFMVLASDLVTQMHVILCATLKNRRNPRKPATKHACLVGTTLGTTQEPQSIQENCDLLTKVAIILKRNKYHTSFLQDDRHNIVSIVEPTEFECLHTSSSVYRYFKDEQRALSAEYQPTTGRKFRISDAGSNSDTDNSVDYI